MGKHTSTKTTASQGRRNRNLSRAHKLAYRAGLGLVLTLSITGLLFGAHKVYALSATGPDSSDFATGSAFYSLSNTRDVQSADQTGIAIYHQGNLPTGDTTITINFQNGQRVSSNQNQQGYGCARFDTPSHTGTTCHSATANLISLTIHPNDWVPLGYGGYETVIHGTLTGGRSGDDSNHLNFTVHAGGSNNFVGPNGQSHFTVLQGKYNCSGTSCNQYGYHIPFAPACVLDDGNTAVNVYDVDNPNSLIQPASFGLHIQVVDTTTGNVVNNNNFSGSESNGGIATFSFAYSKHHKYRLDINHASALNVLQILLPFDSVAAKEDCTPPPPPNAQAHGKIDATCTYDNTTGERTYHFRANYYDNDGTAAVPARSFAISAGASASAKASQSNYIHGDSNKGSYVRDINYPTGQTGYTWDYTGTWPGDITTRNSSGNRVVQYHQVELRVYDIVPGGSDHYVYGDVVSQPACPPPTGGSAIRCGGSNTNLDAALTLNVQTDDFQVWASYTGPKPSGSFHVTVTDPTGVTRLDNTAAATAANGLVNSQSQHFTPLVGGTYTLTWSFPGMTPASCSTTRKAGYSPFLSVVGGDVAAGPGFGAGCTDSEADSSIIGRNLDTTGSGPFYGAGTQLAALATGDVSGFATSQNETGYTGTASDAGGGTGKGLAFANTTAAAGTNKYGGSFYGVVNAASPSPGWCTSDYAGSAIDKLDSPSPVQPPSDTVDVGSVGSGIVYYKPTSGTLTLGGTITAGSTPQRLTLVVKGDVYISSDIAYATNSSSYASAADVPQFQLLVQGNIYINPQVHTLQGFYVAQPVVSSGGVVTDGTIDTCAQADGTAYTDYASCDSTPNPNSPSLRIIGAISARSIRFGRTSGSIRASGSTTTQPAEEITFTPELWLANLVGPSDGCRDAAGGTVNANSCTYQAFTDLPPVL